MIIKVDTPNQKYAKKNDLPSCVYIYTYMCVCIIIMLWFCFCCLHAFYIRQEMCYASGVTPPVFKFPIFSTECTRGPTDMSETLSGIPAIGIPACFIQN